MMKKIVCSIFILCVVGFLSLVLWRNFEISRLCRGRVEVQLIFAETERREPSAETKLLAEKLIELAQPKARSDSLEYALPTWIYLQNGLVIAFDHRHMDKDFYYELRSEKSIFGLSPLPHTFLLRGEDKEEIQKILEKMNL